MYVHIQYVHSHSSNDLQYIIHIQIHAVRSSPVSHPMGFSSSVPVPSEAELTFILSSISRLVLQLSAMAVKGWAVVCECEGVVVEEEVVVVVEVGVGGVSQSCDELDVLP